MAVLDKVTDFLLFLGKLLIVGIVGMTTTGFWCNSSSCCLQRLSICCNALTFLFIHTGIFSFFFFSGRIKAVEDAAPSLNYYWVPILVSVFNLDLL